MSKKTQSQDRSKETNKSRAEMRIAKRIARAGICSRRDAERKITAGQVKVNDQTISSPAINVNHKDRIQVDGKDLPALEPVRLWRYHKKRGLVSTSRDEKDRKTIFEELPKDLPRVISIGRLDINTEGLLLLTNDGNLARHLELPSTGWLRRYKVRAKGNIDQEQLDKLKDGVTIDGVKYGSVSAIMERKQGANSWFLMGLREGKNREIKRIATHLGLEVNRLIRLSYGPFQLGDLPAGSVEEVRPNILADQLGPGLAREFGLTVKQKLKSKNRQTRDKDSSGIKNSRMIKRSERQIKGQTNKRLRGKDK